MKFSLAKLTDTVKHLRFTANRQQALLEDIAALLDDGVPINQTIEVLLRIIHNTAMRAVLQSIQQKIAEGKPMADGMQSWYPQHIVEIVRAGELGGTLVESMNVAVESASQKNMTLSALIDAMAYPLVVLLAGLGLAVFLNNSIFKDFAAIQPIEHWPINGQMAYHFASFVQHFWWLILLALIVLGFTIRRILNDYIGELRYYIDRTPPFSLYRQVIAARLMETMGLLLSNGVILKNALKVLQLNSQPYLASHLLVMEYRLSGGRDNIAEVLDTGLIDNSDLERLRVIAKGRGFEHALIRQGKRAMTRTVNDVRLAGRISGGITLVLGAGLAAFLILAIYGIGSVLGK